MPPRTAGCDRRGSGAPNSTRQTCGLKAVAPAGRAYARPTCLQSISFPNWFNWTNTLDLWVGTVDLSFMAGATPRGVTVPGDERKKEQSHGLYFAVERSLPSPSRGLAPSKAPPGHRLACANDRSRAEL
ncbi:protein of unknown function [Hyphomicrobium sp. MC1]|nr:protein of unknown function [Hyphomicrobium sp. MC1]